MIKIYTTPTCPYCHMAKDYFNSQKIKFEEIDVSTDKSKIKEMVELCMPKGGQMGVPVIKIDDELIIGFDQEKIEKILKPNG